jgi:hydrogenase expression/formation protein HypE
MTIMPLDIPGREPKALRRPLDLERGRVDMSHGAGGRAMADLIDQVFRPAFENAALAAGEDQAVLNPPPGRLAISTDTFVISPLFFPGGNIGSLAVHGTVNDVAMAGARVLWLTAGFVIEEGFPLKDLRAIAQSMGAAAREAGVLIVTGDTKVVERGKGDGVFINTAGVGIIERDVSLGAHRIRPGDAIIVSGTIGDHGVAVMAHRQGLEFDTEILSDSASLNGLIAAMLDAVPEIKALRDPTRGGLAATLNEYAHAARVGIAVDEASLPIKPDVHGACEFLGLDPMTIANEGKLIAVVPAESAEALVNAMRAHPLGRDAAIIARVVEDRHHFVRMTTRVGGERVVDWLAGEQLPRIC